MEQTDNIDEIVDTMRVRRRQRRLGNVLSQLLESEDTLASPAPEGSSSASPAPEESSSMAPQVTSLTDIEPAVPTTIPSAQMPPAIQAANPPSSASSTGSNVLGSMNGLMIGGIVVAAVTMLAIAGFLVYRRKSKKRATLEGDEQSDHFDDKDSVTDSFKPPKGQVKLASKAPARPVSTMSMESIPPTISTQAFFLSQRPLSVPTTPPPDMPLPPAPLVPATAIPLSRGPIRPFQPQYYSADTMSTMASSNLHSSNYYRLSEAIEQSVISEHICENDKARDAFEFYVPAIPEFSPHV